MCKQKRICINIQKGKLRVSEFLKELRSRLLNDVLKKSYVIIPIAVSLLIVRITFYKGSQDVKKPLPQEERDTLLEQSVYTLDSIQQELKLLRLDMQRRDSLYLTTITALKDSLHKQTEQQTNSITNELELLRLDMQKRDSLYLTTLTALKDSLHKQTQNKPSKNNSK